jgi:hypothetical protein
MKPFYSQASSTPFLTYSTKEFLLLKVDENGFNATLESVPNYSDRLLRAINSTLIADPICWTIRVYTLQKVESLNANPLTSAARA